jgi:hypothetical protein
MVIRGTKEIRKTAGRLILHNIDVIGDQSGKSEQTKN